MGHTAVVRCLVMFSVTDRTRINKYGEKPEDVSSLEKLSLSLSLLPPTPYPKPPHTHSSSCTFCILANQWQYYLFFHFVICVIVDDFSLPVRLHSQFVITLHANCPPCSNQQRRYFSYLTPSPNVLQQPANGAKPLHIAKESKVNGVRTTPCGFKSPACTCKHIKQTDETVMSV